MNIRTYVCAYTYVRTYKVCSFVHMHEHTVRNLVTMQTQHASNYICDRISSLYIT